MERIERLAKQLGYCKQCGGAREVTVPVDAKRSMRVACGCIGRLAKEIVKALNADPRPATEAEG